MEGPRGRFLGISLGGFHVAVPSYGGILIQIRLDVGVSLTLGTYLRKYGKSDLTAFFRLQARGTTALRLTACCEPQKSGCWQTPTLMHEFFEMVDSTQLSFTLAHVALRNRIDHLMHES